MSVSRYPGLLSIKFEGLPEAQQHFPGSRSNQTLDRSLRRPSLRVREGLDTSITASTVAPLVYRASPIDPTLRAQSASEPQARDLSNYTTTSSSEDRMGSLIPTPAEISRPSSTSTQSSNACHPSSGSGLHQSVAVNDNNYSSSSLHHHSSLPGLSALASVASAPTSQLRYVTLVRFNSVISTDASLPSMSRILNRNLSNQETSTDFFALPTALIVMRARI